MEQGMRAYDHIIYDDGDLLGEDWKEVRAAFEKTILLEQTHS
jgi:hypothetical protein